jgi:hypothetical protein
MKKEDLYMCFACVPNESERMENKDHDDKRKLLPSCLKKGKEKGE